MTSAAGKRICFVACPIGGDGSETRQRSEVVLKYIIAPALESCGYEAVRADQIPKPGLITSQVIDHVVHDPLMIADLTERNPNVFYELALRHAVKKPVIQMIHRSEAIPFDVAGSRTIRFDHQDVPSVEETKQAIAGHVRAIEADPADVDNPISVALDLDALRRSNNPLEKTNAEIMTMLDGIRSLVLELRDGPKSLLARVRSGSQGGYTRTAGDLTTRVAKALYESGPLRLMRLGVPTTDAIEFALKVGYGWDVFEDAVRQMQSLGLIYGQPTVGTFYIELTDIGKRLVESRPSAIGKSPSS